MTTPTPPDGKTSILIVEDSLTQSLRLQMLLEKHGFAVTAAKHGEEGLQILEKMQPDLVISDIQMPGIDGFELCRRIKETAGETGFPVMLLTSLSSPEDIIHGLESGADNFVVKPYEEEFLMRRIDSVLSNRVLQQVANDSAGIVVEFAGHQYTIDSTRRQILNLLLSTYETAVQTNCDLILAHEQLKEAQAELIQAEKLQTIGRLAAGVAHEVRNPLAIMEMGLTYLGTMDLPPDGQLILEQVREAVRRAESVVAGLMETGSPREMGMREVDLASVLRHALLTLSDELSRTGIEVQQEIAPGLPPLTIDEAKMEQVFTNLFTNAAQAMSSGGVLTVRASMKTLGTGDGAFNAGDRSGVRFRDGERIAVIEISDTGSGILPENLGKVFDPFFSTKPTGKGVGLGLTVARKIVELHSGSIEVQNAPGGSGAMVRIALKLP